MKLFTTGAPRRAGVVALGIVVASLAYAGPSRPFKGSLDVIERIGRLTRCPGLQGQPGQGGTFTGGGHASHLGKVQVSGSHCIEVEPGVPTPFFRLFDGRLAMRAANGDVVLADYSGVFTFTSAGNYTFQGDYVITGGTGRFEDASGTGELTGVLEGPVPSFEQAVTLEPRGEIAY